MPPRPAQTCWMVRDEVSLQLSQGGKLISSHFISFAFPFLFISLLSGSLAAVVHIPVVVVSRSGYNLRQFITEKDKQPFTLTPAANSVFPLCLTCRFLDCGRQLEYQERSSTDTESILHRRPRAWESNPQPSCCVADQWQCHILHALRLYFGQMQECLTKKLFSNLYIVLNVQPLQWSTVRVSESRSRGDVETGVDTTELARCFPSCTTLRQKLFNKSEIVSKLFKHTLTQNTHACIYLCLVLKFNVKYATCSVTGSSV